LDQRNACFFEVASHREDQFVDASLHLIGLEQRPIGPSVRLGDARFQERAPTLAIETEKLEEKPSGGLSMISIQRVSGKFGGHGQWMVMF
jgi:hypothetical protein